MKISPAIIDAAVELCEQEYLNTLLEGVDDPGIMKCVFLSGGPGSGKSTAASRLFNIDRSVRASFSSFGLKIVDSDRQFEYLLHKIGIDPKDLSHIEKNDPELWHQLTVDPNGPRERAKVLTRKMHMNYYNGRLGVIVDGTGDDYDKIHRQKQQAESFGYDCFLVIVNTDLETCLRQNKGRGRVLPDAIVEQIWTNVQKQLPKLRTLFDPNYVQIDHGVPDGPNNIDKYKSVIHNAVRAFISRPIRNPIGREWVTIQRAVEHLKSSTP